MRCGGVDHPGYLLRLSELELIDRHHRMVGQPGLEPGTSVLSGLRSNRLSYWPFGSESSGGTARPNEYSRGRSMVQWFKGMRSFGASRPRDLAFRRLCTCGASYMATGKTDASWRDAPHGPVGRSGLQGPLHGMRGRHTGRRALRLCEGLLRRRATGREGSVDLAALRAVGHGASAHPLLASCPHGVPVPRQPESP